MPQFSSRRRLLKSGLMAGLLAPFARAVSAAPAASGASEGAAKTDFKIGIASYSFRKMSLDDTIKALKRLNLSYISVKDFHLALNSSAAERATAVQKLKEGGITPLSCGNITMQNDEANVRQAFQYARDLGVPAIVCSPDPASIPLLDKMVKEFDIRLAIHNHGPEDKRFPSPYDVWKAVEKWDSRIGLCIDVGHTARAGVNPAEAIVKCKSRLYDLHFKDINSTAPNGTTIEAGRGVLDLPAIVKALQKVNFDHLVSIEFEGWENDPLPAVAETLGYLHGLLATSKGKAKV